MYNVVVKVDEKEFRYQFKHFWQVEWFVRILNFVVGLIVKQPNTGFQADGDGMSARKDERNA